MEFDCKITQSSIYSSRPEITLIVIEADSFDEARRKLQDEAVSIDSSSTVKLVEDIQIKVNEKWIFV